MTIIIEGTKVEPPSPQVSLQRPLFYNDSSLNLSTKATFFCPIFPLFKTRFVFKCSADQVRRYRRQFLIVLPGIKRYSCLATSHESLQESIIQTIITPLPIKPISCLPLPCPLHHQGLTADTGYFLRTLNGIRIKTVLSPNHRTFNKQLSIE